MTTLIDQLSPAARDLLSTYHDNTLGVISAYKNENTADENALAHSDLFRSSEQFGKFKIDERDAQGELIRVSLLLNSGKGDDSGNLVGFLKKQTANLGVPSFLFKHHLSKDFTEIANPNVPYVKYEYTDRIVKLVALRSFSARVEQEW